MSTPATPPEPPDEPATGPTEPMSSGDPLEPGPERPHQQTRRLTRSSSDKVLGGVSGGLGRYFDIDPIIFRIGFVVLTLAGGAGFVAYVAAWLLVPADPVPGAAPVDRNRVLTVLGGGILVIAALIALGHGLFFIGPPLIACALIALLGVALWRAAEDRGGDGAALVRRAMIAVGLIVLAGVIFVAGALGAAAGGGAIIAGLVIALGAGLALAAFTGGARWLALPALALAVPLGFVAASGADVKGGTGERDYRPTTVAELQDGYHLGTGDLRLDLRGVDFPGGRTPLKVDLGIGSVRVFVPDDVCVASDMRVGVGYARVLGRDNGGFDVDWRHTPREAPGVKRLVIAGHVGIGALQVVHFPGEIGDHVHGAGFDGRVFDPVGQGSQDDAPCEAPA
jgi:phage shock protein PspC (stress-responsive transcriptional regulator)